MKKIVLFLFVAIATLSVKAQDLYMGGTVGLWRNDDANTTLPLNWLRRSDTT